MGKALSNCGNERATVTLNISADDFKVVWRAMDTGCLTFDACTALDEPHPLLDFAEEYGVVQLAALYTGNLLHKSPLKPSNLGQYVRLFSAYTTASELTQSVMEVLLMPICWHSQGEAFMRSLNKGTVHWLLGKAELQVAETVMECARLVADECSVARRPGCAWRAVASIKNGTVSCDFGPLDVAPETLEALPIALLRLSLESIGKEKRKLKVNTSDPADPASVTAAAAQRSKKKGKTEMLESSSVGHLAAGLRAAGS